jgi:hypothetical protein
MNSTFNACVKYCYAERHNAECRYAQCHYAECHYAECRHAECHYAECGSAQETIVSHLESTAASN